MKEYFGGHNNIITPQERDALIAAGYGAYIKEEALV